MIKWPRLLSAGDDISSRRAKHESARARESESERERERESNVPEVSRSSGDERKKEREARPIDLICFPRQRRPIDSIPEIDRARAVIRERKVQIRGAGGATQQSDQQLGSINHQGESENPDSWARGSRALGRRRGEEGKGRQGASERRAG